jgi:hypothetical protein
MPDTNPVMVVHGILGRRPEEPGPMRYRGSAFTVRCPPERHEASIGPLSSAHDRTCELAGQICNFSTQHAKTGLPEAA